MLIVINTNSVSYYNTGCEKKKIRIVVKIFDKDERKEKKINLICMKKKTE